MNNMVSIILVCSVVLICCGCTEQEPPEIEPTADQIHVTYEFYQIWNETGESVRSWLIEANITNNAAALATKINVTGYFYNKTSDELLYQSSTIIENLLIGKSIDIEISWNVDDVDWNILGKKLESFVRSIA